MQLRADAERGAFDVIVCEALDRIGRKLDDIAELHGLLTYLGVWLLAVATGEVTALRVGMLGTMSTTDPGRPTREDAAWSAGT